MKSFSKLFVASFMAICGVVWAQSNTPASSPDAKVKVDLQVYVLVSGQSANVTSGTLSFQGKDYPFKVKGIGLYKNQMGASHLVADGAVYNLKNISDLEGKYFMFAGGIEEVGWSKIRSDKNVVIELKGWSKGPVVIQPEGATIEFTK